MQENLLTHVNKKLSMFLFLFLFIHYVPFSHRLFLFLILFGNIFVFALLLYLYLHQEFRFVSMCHWYHCLTSIFYGLICPFSEFFFFLLIYVLSNVYLIYIFKEVGVI